MLNTHVSAISPEARISTQPLWRVLIKIELNHNIVMKIKGLLPPVHKWGDKIPIADQRHDKHRQNKKYDYRSDCCLSDNKLNTAVVKIGE